MTLAQTPIDWIKCFRFWWQRRAMDFYLFKLYFGNIYLPKWHFDMNAAVCFIFLFFFLKILSIQIDCCDLFYCLRIVKQKFSIYIAYEANDPKISNYCNVSILSMEKHRRYIATLYGKDQSPIHLPRNANFAVQYWRF